MHPCVLRLWTFVHPFTDRGDASQAMVDPQPRGTTLSMSFNVAGVRCTT